MKFSGRNDADYRLTCTAGVGRLENFAVRFDGGTQLQRLIIKVDVLYGVAEAEVGQNNVEHPGERLAFFSESHPRTFQHVRQHHCTCH